MNLFFTRQENRFNNDLSSAIIMIDDGYYVDCIHSGNLLETYYNKFYDSIVKSQVTFVFNPQPTRTKTFKTISYTGSNGWKATVLTNDYTGVDTNPQEPALGDTTYLDTGQTILSYDDGFYTDPNTGVEYRAGFYRKQNVYYAAIKGNGGTGILAGQVISSNVNTTGLKGQYLAVTLKQDKNTDPAGAKQLFSVGAEYNNR